MGSQNYSRGITSLRKIILYKTDFTTPTQCVISWPVCFNQAWILAPAKYWVMLHSGNSFICYRRLKTQKHPLLIWFFNEHFNDIYWCNFFIFQTVQWVWVKRFYTNTFCCCCCCFFDLLGTAPHPKTFYMSLHSTKTKERYKSTMTL